uniref:BPTI/Kunitz inhibitor domain-containing protein n=1 Tax=Nippostrongylus brasiliensis TaxID=27835 RepID=A0A0N4YNI3_NIPBR
LFHRTSVDFTVFSSRYVFRYYFNKRSRQCKGFHYTGCGKSGNNFLTKEECHEKCEKRYPRSVELPAAVKGKGRKKPSRLQSGYSGQKPPEKASMLRHVVLDGSYKSTNGEEFCNVQRPFLRGTHLYTWYFDMDIKDPPYILSNPASGRIQRDNETIAAILILKPNHCGDIC